MMEELGSGFYLAMHDLEIRGAGEILGEQQSGEIQEIGFSLYARMLERAVRRLKAGKSAEVDDAIDISTEVNLHMPALLPETYCSDVHERLSLYKRLADTATREELDLLREELVDRFGELPDAARALVECHRVRIAARALGVARVDATHEAVQLQFIKNPPLDGAKVIEFIRKKGPQRPPRRAGEAARRRQAPRLAGARPGGDRHPPATRSVKSGSEPDFQKSGTDHVFPMNLVIQGPALAAGDVEAIALLAKPAAVQTIAPHAFRLCGAMKNEGIAPLCEARRIDHAWMEEGRRFADLRLLAMDMDSTLITIECIDELGDLAGKKTEIATITSQAMRGEIEYRESLRRRVRALAGLPEDSLNTSLRGATRSSRLAPKRCSPRCKKQWREAAAGLRRLHFFHRTAQGAPRSRLHDFQRARGEGRQAHRRAARRHRRCRRQGSEVPSGNG